MRGLLLRLFLFTSLLLFTTTAVAGCGSGKNSGGGLPYLGEKPGENAGQAKNTPAQPGQQLTGETTSIILYFGDQEGFLVAEKRSIPKTRGVARAAVQELIRGPAAGSGLLPTLPPGTSLNSIKISEGTATVDFSKELQTGHKGGSAGEMVTVYSIVNTLTQFPTVQRVQVLVEGRVVETLAGHLDLSRPLTRNSNIIRQKQGTN